MMQLKETLVQYRAKIRAYDLKLSKGQAYIEVPCQHAELISQLEVSLSSKKNEIIHLRQHLGKLQRSNDGELQQWYSKLERIRAEVKKISVTKVHTEANVVGGEKINELKGKLIDLQEKENNLQSEMNGLKNVKNEQDISLKSGLNNKNMPEKLRELRIAMSSLKQQKKELEDKIKEIQKEKKKNFDEIIKLEDQLRDAKAKAKRQETKKQKIQHS